MSKPTWVVASIQDGDDLPAKGKAIHVVHRDGKILDAFQFSSKAVRYAKDLMKDLYAQTVYLDKCIVGENANDILFERTVFAAVEQTRILHPSRVST